MLAQFLKCNSLSMVAGKTGKTQYIFIIYNTVVIVPFSMCSNIFRFADLHIFSHKKELSGQQ